MRELELYLHVPFCLEKCGYCDFLSGKGNEETKGKYLEALEREIGSYEGRIQGYEVSSVFVGGGTPSLLSGSQVKRIFGEIRKVFRIRKDAEITMEMNPGTVTRENLCGYLDAGVNRVSLGLQSADDEELRMLGRIHDYGTFLETYGLLRELSVGNVNVDLISGIPGQTVGSFEEGLRKVAKLGAEHISAYSLIVEEGTRFYQIYGDGREGKNGFAALPSEEEERKIYHLTQRLLKEYGYERYEISNYAKKGFACRHNLGYWERREYLGFGIGAASLFNGERFANTKSQEEYIRAAGDVRQIQKDREVLTKQACMEEFMFLGLRKIEGVSEMEFQNTFGVSMEEIYGKVIGELVKKKLLAAGDGRIFLTEKGIDISNSVMVEFLL